MKYFTPTWLQAQLRAILAVFTKRRDVFRSEFAKRQIAELVQIRSDLAVVFSDLSYVASVKDTLLTTGRSQDDWRVSNPEGYEQYERYKNASLNLFYKFTDPDYDLFPPSLNRRAIEDFGRVMQHWAPFTIQATSRSHEEKKAYMHAILKIQDEFQGAIEGNV